MNAFYRSGGDPWENVSLRKEAQTYFDLTAHANGQIEAVLDLPRNISGPTK
jgi:hypothetical protein